MRAYWAVFSARFRVLLQYRAAALAGLGTQLFWGFIRVMIFTAFFNSSTAPQPMTLDETVAYIWLGQAFLLLLPWNTEREIENMIRTGNVAYELVRPLDLYSLWFFRGMAMRVAPLLLRAVPMFCLAVLFFGLNLPASWQTVPAFGLCLLGAILLSSAITALTTISLFWTISGEGVIRILPGITLVLSGLVIPLPLFPDWMQPVLNFLPFRGILDIPFRLYIGHFPVSSVFSLFFHQIGWTIALVILGRILLTRGLRRVVVQGG